MNDLKIKQIKDKILTSFENKISFISESHEYFKDGEKFTCVSDITHIYKPVSGEQMAENCVARWKREMNPSYKYFGMTKEQILEMWSIKSKGACDLGTDVHSFGEAMFYYFTEQMDVLPDDLKGNFLHGKPHTKNKFESAIFDFWKNLPPGLHPVLCETRVFNESGTKYAGTFDILFCDDNGNLWIFDYKTNEDLYKCYKDTRLKHPFQEYQDMNISYYMLQLGLYQIPLENIGFTVVNRVIVWLKPDGTYNLIYLKDVTDILRKELKIKNKNG